MVLFNQCLGGEIRELITLQRVSDVIVRLDWLVKIHGISTIVRYLE